MEYRGDGCHIGLIRQPGRELSEIKIEARSVPGEMHLPSNFHEDFASYPPELAGMFAPTMKMAQHLRISEFVLSYHKAAPNPLF